MIHETKSTSPVHPAIHGGRGPRKELTPLFPREARRLSEKEARKRAMAAHPAGKGVPHGNHGASCGGPYAVKAGDSLWEVAADALDTRSIALVAHYWPVIHRNNVDAIGHDPDLIVPGQVLDLPECDR